MIRKPDHWARGDISQDHSKSSAYAHGFREGWDAALAAVRSKVGEDGLIDQHRIIEADWAYQENHSTEPDSPTPEEPQ